MLRSALLHGIGDAVAELPVGGGRCDVDHQRNVLGPRYRNKLQGDDLAGGRLDLTHDHAVGTGFCFIKRL